MLQAFVKGRVEYYLFLRAQLKTPACLESNVAFEVMPITREKKAEVLTKLKNIFSDFSVVFVNFHGLSVAESNNLRRELKQSGAEYYVAKKTLVKKALSESGKSGEAVFEGELAMAYGSDALSAGRKIYDLQKKLNDKISILGGIFEDRLISREEMTALAQIPPKEVLYAQFVNLINSPIQRLVIGLNQVAEKKG